MKNKCPGCGKGKVFKGLFQMNPKCSSCGMVFGHENEPGFFLGAMIANYFLLTIALLPTLVIPIFVLDWSVSATLLLGVLQVLILFPFLFRFSRLLWLHGEARLTRALDGEGKKGRSPS